MYIRHDSIFLQYEILIGFSKYRKNDNVVRLHKKNAKKKNNDRDKICWRGSFPSSYMFTFLLLQVSAVKYCNWITNPIHNEKNAARLK